MFVLSFRAAPSSLSPSSPPLCSHFSLHCRGQRSAACVTESGHASNTFKSLLCQGEMDSTLCEASYCYGMEVNNKYVLNNNWIFQRNEGYDLI